jgi:hypothetical protein
VADLAACVLCLCGGTQHAHGSRSLARALGTIGIFPRQPSSDSASFPWPPRTKKPPRAAPQTPQALATTSYYKANRLAALTSEACSELGTARRRLQDELRRLLHLPRGHLRRRPPAARRLLPLRLLQRKHSAFQTLLPLPEHIYIMIHVSMRNGRKSMTNSLFFFCSRSSSSPLC